MLYINFSISDENFTLLNKKIDKIEKKANSIYEFKKSFNKLNVIELFTFFF